MDCEETTSTTWHCFLSPGVCQVSEEQGVLQAVPSQVPQEARYNDGFFYSVVKWNAFICLLYINLVR